MLERLQIFISSPGDVQPERVLTEQVVTLLGRQFSSHFDIGTVRWEREPLRATEHFQEGIPRAAETDLVVVILWSRLGSPMPEGYRGPLSGRIVTGTEFEFEDAVKGYREHQRPDLLLYQKTGAPPIKDDKEAEAYLNEYAKVKAFFNTWFIDEKTHLPKTAWRQFQQLEEFEQMLTDHLTGFIRRRLDAPRRAAAEGRVEWYQGSPFRGLESFEIGHAPIFFGRTRARNELRQLLVRQAGRAQPWVMVLGGSGSGKSSLVKAGLLHDITIPGLVEKVGLCRYAILRPSDAKGDLLAGLASALIAATALPELGDLQYNLDRLTAFLRAAPTQAALPVEQALTTARQREGVLPHADTRLAILVDQLEEVFTTGSNSSNLPAFVAVLDALAASGLVWIIATLRTDFIRELEASSDLAKRFDAAARYYLAAPDEVELAQIVETPVQAAGLTFETSLDTGIGLDKAIEAAARVNPAALPLLEYVLDQLWQRRTAEGVLTWKAYHDLGGVEGAIGARAEEVFNLLPPEAQAALPKVLRALVSVPAGEDSPPTAQFAPIEQFPNGTPGRALVEAFLDGKARLLVATGDGEGARVRMAHEALLSHWTRAASQIRADRKDLQLRNRLEQQAALWSAALPSDQPSLLLTPGLPLSEAGDLLDRRREELNSLLIRYIGKSQDAWQEKLAGAEAQAQQEFDLRRRMQEAAFERDMNVALAAQYHDVISHYSAAANDTVLNPRTVQVDNSKMLATSYRIAFPASSRECGRVLWYFEHRFFDSRPVSRLHQQLQFMRALGLLTPDDERQLAEAQKTDLLSSIYAVVRYEGDIGSSPFLQSGRAIDRLAYAQYVRKAMWLAVASDSVYGFRARILNDDKVWEEASSLGPAQIGNLFPDMNPVQVASVTADYLKAAWWSVAMSKASQAFAELWTRATQTPGIRPEDAGLQVAQRNVAKSLAQISSLDNPRNNFHEPWGLLTLDLAFGQQAAAEITITGVGPPIRRKRAIGTLSPGA